MKKLICSILMAAAAMLITLTAAAQIATDSVIKIEIKVVNLHCGNDMPTIKKRLLNQEGVDEVKFTDLASESSLFTITYHTSVTSRQQIEQAIESTPGCDNKNETPYKVKRKKTKS
jgi:copper chaperone CopZ